MILKTKDKRKSSVVFHIELPHELKAAEKYFYR